jgi:hypothetical protein
MNVTIKNTEFKFSTDERVWVAPLEFEDVECVLLDDNGVPNGGALDIFWCIKENIEVIQLGIRENYRRHFRDSANLEILKVEILPGPNRYRANANGVHEAHATLKIPHILTKSS